MSYKMPVDERLAAIRIAGQGHKLRVTILGAGMAGLAAAHELQQLGHEVTIIEATGRVGGRVDSWRPAGPDGPVHEFGAMRIPRKHDFTYHYLEKLGLADRMRPFITAHKEQDAYFYLRGKLFRMIEAGLHIPELYALSEADAQAVRQIRPDGPPIKPTLSGVLMGQVFGPVMSRLTGADEAALICEGPETELAKEIDGTPFGELVRKSLAGLDARDLAGVAHGLDVWWHKSSAMFIREEFLGDGPPLHELEGGLDQLPTALYRQLADGTVRFYRAVVAIANEADRVTLVTQRTDEQHPSGYCPVVEDAEREIVEADVVLCTIPFAVLRGMELSGVSAPKMSAIRAMNYASSTKVLLHCSRRPWEPAIQGGATMSDTILRSTYYPSDHARLAESWAADEPSGETLFWIKRAASLIRTEGFGGEGDKPAILVASYSWDQDARRMGAIPRAERGRVCLDVLERIHPGISKAVVACESRFWDEHPWARGAFAFAHPGEIPEHFENGRVPEGRLFFAGEHLSFNQGWIQGALKSSLLAVQNMLERWS